MTTRSTLTTQVEFFICLQFYPVFTILWYTQYIPVHKKCKYRGTDMNVNKNRHKKHYNVSTDIPYNAGKFAYDVSHHMESTN